MNNCTQVIMADSNYSNSKKKQSLYQKSSMMLSKTTSGSTCFFKAGTLPKN